MGIREANHYRTDMPVHKNKQKKEVRQEKETETFQSQKKKEKRKKETVKQGKKMVRNAKKMRGSRRDFAVSLSTADTTAHLHGDLGSV